MKLFGGAALPTDLATTFTSTFALGMIGYTTVRDAHDAIHQRARSWYEGSELADRVRLFGGASFITVLGPAICADMVLRPSGYGDVSRLEAAKYLLKASFTIGPRAMTESVGEGVGLAARGVVTYITSRNVWIDHFVNNPSAMFEMWGMLAVSVLEEVTRMLNDYAAVRMCEYEEVHRTEGA